MIARRDHQFDRRTGHYGLDVESWYADESRRTRDVRHTAAALSRDERRSHRMRSTATTGTARITPTSPAI